MRAAIAAICFFPSALHAQEMRFHCKAQPPVADDAGMSIIIDAAAMKARVLRRVSFDTGFARPYGGLAPPPPASFWESAGLSGSDESWLVIMRDRMLTVHRKPNASGAYDAIYSNGLTGRDAGYVCVEVQR